MKIRKFKLDKEIERIAKKVAKITKINICGVDFAKQNGRWIVIEVNAEPSLKFFDCERDMMIEEVLRFLKSQV